MAYKVGTRMQQTLLPSTIDDYVSEADPVRVYDDFVDALNFVQLGIPIESFKSGAETYYPKQMVKLLVYGYAYGTRSSRKLERACHHNLSFIWLMGGLTPDYRTIARFRDKYKDAIKNILKQCVEMCIKLELVDGNTLFVDSSIFKANASLSNTWNHKRCEKALIKINEHIDRLMDEVQKTDQQEDNQNSLVEVKEQLQNSQQRKRKVEEIVNELNSRSKETARQNGQITHYNTTDPECSKIHKSQKTAAGYTVQMVVDEKHGFIVHGESTSIPNDAQQLSPHLLHAQEVLDKKPSVVCSDSGYYSLKDLAKVDPGIAVIIPSQQQVHKERHKTLDNPFAKEHFIYDAKADQYVCPQGHRLHHKGYNKEKQAHAYQGRSTNCQPCLYFKQCTSSPKGRVIKRLVQEELKERLQRLYESQKGQQCYRLRKQKAELPFGHLKRNLSAQQFLLRGRRGTTAEVSLLFTGFNIARMITIFGIPKLLMSLQGMVT